MIFSENQLISLASNNPKELIKILTSPDIDVGTLTYGVEILAGEPIEEELILPVFMKLLKHFNAMVREGAMVGVSAYFSKKVPQELFDRLKIISASDPSCNNKEYAKDLLKDFSGV